MTYQQQQNTTPITYPSTKYANAKRSAKQHQKMMSTTMVDPDPYPLMINPHQNQTR